ncbi:hypothetical protein PIB30_030469 [Stylosanthes scabra]|uniref:WRKY domain-containing protein n=1 Tax=Stylosanthes scabra TaxID=79078 RepID=A0ABU6UDD5_9FABA|nr:hypothetical protein [Stylosanthes scabra]
MEAKKTPPPPPPPPSQSTTSTNDFSFFDDFFFEKPPNELVEVGDFGPYLYEWLGIDDEDAVVEAAVQTPVNHPPPPSSPTPSSIILESSEAALPPPVPNSQNSSEYNPAIANNNNTTTTKTAGHKRRAESVAGDGGNGSVAGDEADDENNNIKNRLKLRAATMAKIAATLTMNQRRSDNNVPKFAFLTESEEEYLEDGYRWRKYGQKMVRHSPFPRSYYRCTAIGCNVKKRVERSPDDPTHVMTTYEGLHYHGLPPELPPPRPFSIYSSDSIVPITAPKPPFPRRVKTGCSCCRGVGGGDGGSGSARAGHQVNNTIASVNVENGAIDSGDGSARAGNHANNSVTSVNVNTGANACGGGSGVSGVNDAGSERSAAIPTYVYDRQMQFVEQAVASLQSYSAPNAPMSDVTPMDVITDNHDQSFMDVDYEDFFGDGSFSDFASTSSAPAGEDLVGKKIGTGLLEDILNFSPSMAPHPHDQQQFLWP